MAEVLGAMNILDRALPTGLDGTRLAEWALNDGVTYQELANQLALALADANAELVSKWGWLFFLTEELFLNYPDGGSVSEMPEITDQDRPEPVHGEDIGHMIDLRAYGSAIGGSRRYFRDIRSAKLRSSISTIVRQGIWRFEKKLLTRWFTNTENVIGSAGYDVPFVRGSGGNVDFTPPAFEGEAFDTTHDHYIGVDSDSLGADDSLNQLAEHLQEHGHEPPWVAVVARADVSTYYALADWVEMIDPVVDNIDRGGSTSGAQLFARSAEREMGRIGWYQSEYGLIDVRATARVPTGYAGLAKSAGQLAAGNPLAVRVHPDQGFGLFVVPETTPDDDTPIKQLDVELEFGVSVGEDRTRGAASYLVSGGTWANPTIS